MTAKKRRPEFELGQLIINQVQDYLGRRTVNKLTSLQARNIASICNQAANAVGTILEDGEEEIQLSIEHKPGDD